MSAVLAGRRPANTAAGGSQPTSFGQKAITSVAPDHGGNRIYDGGSEAARRSDRSAGRTRIVAALHHVPGNDAPPAVASVEDQDRAPLKAGPTTATGRTRVDKKGRRRTTLSDIDEQIEQLKAKRRHMVQQRAERFAKIAAQAGLAEVDISDDEALEAFKAIADRFRRPAARTNGSAPPPDATAQSAPAPGAHAR